MRGYSTLDIKSLEEKRRICGRGGCRMKKEEMAFLVDVKALMEHAIMHQQSGSKLGMRLAVNHAHQAVELTLRKKAELLGKNPYFFPEIKKVVKDGGVKIPYERQIDELNKARTLTQHYGTTPNENDARRLIFVARDFLIDFWKEEFEVDYDSVSLFDVISSEDIKKVLKGAQKCFEKDQNYREATIKSVLAIYKIKWWIKSKFIKEPRLLRVGVESWVLRDALDSVLDIALSGPFAYRLRKLGETTGIVFVPIPGGEPHMQQLREYEFVREDALFALELATEYALWAEQVYG